MLIIGGGDGGVLREVVKNPLVESVVLCEIDEVRLKGVYEFSQGLLFEAALNCHLFTSSPV